MMAPSKQPTVPSEGWVRLDYLLALFPSDGHVALLDKLTEAVRAERLEVYRDRGAERKPKKMPASALHPPAHFLKPGFIGTPGTATQPITILDGLYPIFKGEALRKFVQLLFLRPSQTSVNNWVLEQYERACDNGQKQPKRAFVIHDCRREIGATDNQVRKAICLVPRHLKRGVGERDHSSGGRSGVRSGAPD